MTVRRLIAVVVAPVAALAFAVAPAGAATGLGTALKGSPFQYFTEEDTRQFIEAARTAVDSTDVTDETRWANEASGAWGTIVVKRNFKRGGAPCRELRGENTARGRTEPFRLVLCRSKGEWKIASSGAVRK